MPLTDPKVASDILQLLGRLDERGEAHTKVLEELRTGQLRQNGRLGELSTWQAATEPRLQMLEAGQQEIKSRFIAELQQQCESLHDDIAAIRADVDKSREKPVCLDQKWRSQNWGPQAKEKEEREQQLSGYVKQLLVVLVMVIVWALLGHPDKFNDLVSLLAGFVK